jgi:hypothetical protein
LQDLSDKAVTPLLISSFYPKETNKFLIPANLWLDWVKIPKFDEFYERIEEA